MNQNKIIGIHQPNFLPWPGYFSKIIKSDIFVFLDDVKCSKNSFFNRNRFSSNDTWFWLGIPLPRASYNLKINKINVDTSFTNKHIKYFKLNHFKKTKEKKIVENIIDLYEETSEKDFISVSEFNISGIKIILDALGCQTRIVKSSDLDLDRSLKKQNLIIDIVQRLEGDHYISGTGGKSYFG